VQRWYRTTTHGVKTQKTLTWILTAVKTSNLASKLNLSDSVQYRSAKYAISPISIKQFRRWNLRSQTNHYTFIRILGLFPYRAQKNVTVHCTYVYCMSAPQLCPTCDGVRLKFVLKSSTRHYGLVLPHQPRFLSGDWVSEICHRFSVNNWCLFSPELFMEKSQENILTSVHDAGFPKQTLIGSKNIDVSR
jgi:hypothetical protein